MDDIGPVPGLNTAETIGADTSGMTGPSRRTWARLERRATRAYERDLLHRLRELADEEPAVLAVEVNRLQWAYAVIESTGARVVVAGISHRTTTIAGELVTTPAPLRLVGAGRYRPAWWLALDDGTQVHHLAGARVQLLPRRGGPGQTVGAPAGSGLLRGPTTRA